MYTRYWDVLVSLEGVGLVDTLLLSNNPEGEPTFFNHLMNFELFFRWAESLLHYVRTEVTNGRKIRHP